MFSHSCNRTNIFIRRKMKCTIQLGFASFFHLSPHENICTIALINIHYLYTVNVKESEAHCVNGSQLAKMNKMVLEPNVSPHKQIIKDDDVKECISIE